MKYTKLIIISLLLATLISCGKSNNSAINNELELKMNKIAEGYVKLVLNVGLHDPGYVDAYYGPAEWKPADSSVVVKDSIQIQKLFSESGRLLDSLDALSNYKANEIETLRYKLRYLLSLISFLYFLSYFFIFGRYRSHLSHFVNRNLFCLVFNRFFN